MPGFRSCVLAGLLLTGPSGAAVFHVDPQGNDRASGDARRPFRTVSRGVQAAQPGDTVLVHDGTYGPEGKMTGGDESDTSVTPVVFRRSGKPSAWITVRAENKWRAILDCQMRCDAYFDLRDASYIVIQDFAITRGYKEGVHSNDAAHHIVLRGNRIHHIAERHSDTRYGLDGMYTNPKCHDFVIDGNVFHDIGRTGGPRNLDHGLYLRGSEFTVVNNIFYDIENGWAIQLADGLTGILIANNTFATSNPERDGQIMLWNRQRGLTIRNNLFHRPRGHAIARYDSEVEDCEVDHNLVSGARVLMTRATGCATRDNRTGAVLNFEDGDPPYNFRPAPGSAAVGAGTPDGRVTSDFEGRARRGALDIGAFQR